MTNRQNFFSTLAALGLATVGTLPAKAKTSRIRLRDIEHEYDPKGGDLGRGLLMSKQEADALDTTGYEPWTCPGTDQSTFAMYGMSGALTASWYRAYIRREGDKHIVAAVEFYNETGNSSLPKTPQDAISEGWTPYEHEGRRIFQACSMDDGMPTGAHWLGFTKGDRRVNFGVNLGVDGRPVFGPPQEYGA